MIWRVGVFKVCLCVAILILAIAVAFGQDTPRYYDQNDLWLHGGRLGGGNSEVQDAPPRSFEGVYGTNRFRSIPAEFAPWRLEDELTMWIEQQHYDWLRSLGFVESSVWPSAKTEKQEGSFFWGCLSGYVNDYETGKCVLQQSTDVFDINPYVAPDPPKNAREYALGIFKSYREHQAKQYPDAESGWKGYMTSYTFTMGGTVQKFSVDLDGHIDLENITMEDALLSMLAIKAQESLDWEREWDARRERMKKEDEERQKKKQQKEERLRKAKARAKQVMEYCNASYKANPNYLDPACVGLHPAYRQEYCDLITKNGFKDDNACVPVWTYDKAGNMTKLWIQPGGTKR
jgi:hypothetical protein